MWVSVALIIYRTESYLTPLTLKLVMKMGIHTEHSSVGMLSPFQPIGIGIEPYGILGMLRLQSMCMEHPGTNNSTIRHLFPQT